MVKGAGTPSGKGGSNTWMSWLKKSRWHSLALWICCSVGFLEVPADKPISGQAISPNRIQSTFIGLDPVSSILFGFVQSLIRKLNELF
jgi:hypothetical protein